MVTPPGFSIGLDKSPLSALNQPSLVHWMGSSKVRFSLSFYSRTPRTIIHHLLEAYFVFLIKHKTSFMNDLFRVVSLARSVGVTYHAFQPRCWAIKSVKRGVLASRYMLGATPSNSAQPMASGWLLRAW